MKQARPYLSFDGNCRAAMEFYQKNLGGTLTAMPFSDLPGANIPPEARDRLMHSRLTRGSEVVVMASDSMVGMPFTQGNNFNICVDCDSVEEVDTFFNAFSQGGKVIMPADETFFAARFAMATDPFGVNWMFICEKPMPAQ